MIGPPSLPVTVYIWRKDGALDATTAQYMTTLPNRSTASAASLAGYNSTTADISSAANLWHWVWQNATAQVVGIAYVNCVFLPHLDPPKRGISRSAKNNAKLLAKDPEGVSLWRMLEDADVVVPRRRQLTGTLLAYLEAHFPGTFAALSKAIAEVHPQDLEVFEAFVRSTRSIRSVNMLLTRRATFSSYCAWLLPVISRIVREQDTLELLGRDDPYALVLLDFWLSSRRLTAFEAGVLGPVDISLRPSGPARLAAKLLQKVRLTRGASPPDRLRQ